uniref:Uncharacterized protein n=1 Tax=Rhizophora mucronata TaxID=61149 RepID=A0A2P2Q6Z9_RHIMU
MLLKFSLLSSSKVQPILVHLERLCVSVDIGMGFVLQSPSTWIGNMS